MLSSKLKIISFLGIALSIYTWYFNRYMNILQLTAIVLSEHTTIRSTPTVKVFFLFVLTKPLRDEILTFS